MSKLLTLLKKDFIDGIRNWEIMIVVVIPVLLSFVMGAAMSVTSVTLPKIAILAKTESNKKLFPKELFKEIKWINSEEEGTKLLEKSKVHGVIIIPDSISEINTKSMPNKLSKGVSHTPKTGEKNNFLKKIKENLNKPTIKIILDDAELTKTIMIKTIAKKTIEDHFKVSLPINLKFEKYRGLSPKQKMLYMWILMGIFMIGLTVLPMSISSEKEKKTLDALLLTSVTEKDFLVSKIVWGALLMIANIGILLAFNEGLSGNIPALTLVMFTGMLASIATGIFIAMLAPTQSVASMLSTFVLLIMILSSSMSQVNEKLESLVSFLPSYHLAEGFQKSALFDKGFSFIWHHSLIMFIWGLVFMAMSFFLLKRREN